MEVCFMFSIANGMLYIYIYKNTPFIMENILSHIKQLKRIPCEIIL